MRLTEEELERRQKQKKAGASHLWRQGELLDYARPVGFDEDIWISLL